jgi:hypothetical protein
MDALLSVMDEGMASQDEQTSAAESMDLGLEASAAVLEGTAEFSEDETALVPEDASRSGWFYVMPSSCHSGHFAAWELIRFS